MHIGDILNGTYQVERPLGIGGQARVWQARHLRLPRTFAIKECPLLDTEPRERAERRVLFVRERDILAALSHPGHPAIPKVSDFWEESDALFLVMDLVEGETLIDLLIRRGHVNMSEAINWGMQLCQVLTYLHSWQPPIIYRDLSPDNVMLDRAGQLHLIDFGIARTFKPGQPQNTASLGKAGYASPEHLEGGKSQTDVRSDIYTLGALLYHLLTGQEPVAVVERLKQRAQLQGGRALIPPRSINYHLTQEMEHCILQAMELEPARRFQNALEMERALKRYNVLAPQAPPPEMSRIRTRPVDPASLWGTTAAPAATPSSLPPYPQAPKPWPTTPSAPPSPFAQRGPTRDLQGSSGEPPPISGALGPSPLRQMSGPAGSFPTPSGSLPKHPSAPMPPTPSTSPDRPNRPLSTAPSRITGQVPGSVGRNPTGPSAPRPPTQPTGRYPEAQTKPADRALVPSGRTAPPPAPAGSGPLLSRRRLLIGAATLGVAAAGVGLAALFFSRARPSYTVLLTLSDDKVTVQSVTWSPDARQLATGGNNMLVKIWDASSGNLTRFLSGHTDFVQGVAWSPDSASIASASADMTVRIWDALQGGPAQLTLTGHTGTVYSVAWSPDGTRLASASADNTIRIWDAVQGGDAKIVLAGHTADVYSVAWSPDGAFLASGSADGTVKIWNPGQSAPLDSLDNHTGPVRGIAWSPDSKQIAAAAYNKTVTIWNAGNNYTPAYTLTGAGDILTSVAWSQDGTLLAAGSQDNTVPIWNASQNSALSTALSGHSGMVTSVAWANSSMLAAASADGTVIVWRRQS